MGFGDEIVGSGLARGARSRGKRIAFGDGRRIMWGPWCEVIYRGNPNVARPGSEGSIDLEWIAHYKGNRLYVRTHSRNRWVYNRNFKIVPGELFFDDSEIAFAESIKSGFVVIEPHVKPVYPNKQWPVKRYGKTAKALLAAGTRVVQFVYPGATEILCDGIEPIVTPNIRLALAALTRASLYIGPEGALVHGAAAVGVKSVVLFGGFTDPRVLGYPGNANLTGGASSCGSVRQCMHCRKAMDEIGLEIVLRSVQELMGPHASALRDHRQLGQSTELDQGSGARDLRRGDASLSSEALPKA